MTSQEPVDGVVQLAAAGWKDDRMSNCCVVDLGGGKKTKQNKNVMLALLPSVIFKGK